MPTFEKPTGRQRFSRPIGSQAPTTIPAAVAAEIVTDETGSDGSSNDLQSILSDIIARLGHISTKTNFKGVYSNSTTYALGDEVVWTDGNGDKLFFQRTVAGGDGGSGSPQTHTDVWDEVSNDLSSLPVRGTGAPSYTVLVRDAVTGSIYFGRDAAAKIIASLNEGDVDGRVRTLADAAALKGNNTRWTADKLPPGWRGEWDGLNGQQVYIGDRVVHGGRLYSAVVAYTVNTSGQHPSQAPDIDTAHWHQDDNWWGDWVDFWYPDGAMVRQNQGIWIATDDVVRGDPHPSAANNTKWASLSSTAAIIGSSPTIESDGSGNARLTSPGVMGVWAGPSVVERGAVADASIFFNAVRPPTQATRLEVASVPSSLAQYFTNDTIGLTFGEYLPANLDITLEVAFKAPLPQHATGVTFDVRVIHRGAATGQRLGRLQPTIPPTTSVSDLARFTQSLNISGYDWQTYDQIYIDYSAAGTADDDDVLGIISSVVLSIGVAGQTPNPKDYDTWPVQSRPIRDLRSIDTAVATSEGYTIDDITIPNIAGQDHSMVRNAQGEVTGDGWRIDNTETRGHGDHDQHTTDIVVTRDNVQLAVAWHGHFTFADRTDDPGQPDQFRVDIMTQPAANKGGDFNGFVSLAHGFAADLAAYSGPLKGTTINGRTHVITEWTPDSTGATAISQVIKGYISGSLSGTARGIKIDTDGIRRLRLSVSGQTTVEPGNLDVWLIAITPDGSEVQRQLTTGQPPQKGHIWFEKKVSVKSIWDHGFPTSGSPSKFKVDGWYDSDHYEGVYYEPAPSVPWGYWAVQLRQNGDETIDLSGLEIQLDVEWWGDDDDLRSVAIATTHTFQNGDKIAIRGENSTSTTHRRQITADSIGLTVGNAADAQGRTLSVNGTLDANYEWQASSSGGNSTWWTIGGDKRFHALRDMRRMTATIAPATKPTTATTFTLWRDNPFLSSREKIDSVTFGAATPGYLSFTPALAVINGERLFVTADKPVSGNITLTAEAETIGGVPAVQTQVGGLLRARPIIDAALPGGSSSGYAVWRRVPTRPDFHWGDQGMIHGMVESNTSKVWDAFTLHTDLIRELEAMNTNRLGERIDFGNDACITVRLPRRGVDLFIAPIVDGGLAMARGDGTDRDMYAVIE